MKCVVTLLFACLAIPAFAANPKTAILYNFKGAPDGELPSGSLVADAAGNLFGNSAGGHTGCNSSLGCGLVFELIAPASRSGTWAEQVLYSFTGSADGADPNPVAVSEQGNVYGSAGLGGNVGNVYCASLGRAGCGVIFQLSKQNGVWKETVLHTFEGPDGATPSSPLIFDSQGNLYGATYYGGANGGGTVFEMSPSGDGTWTETVLYNFAAPVSQGVYSPLGGVVSDSQGNLYGIALGADGNGNTDYGVIYRLDARTWQETTIYTFGNGEQYAPSGGLTIDQAGNLYGITPNGGVVNSVKCPLGCGTIFELSPANGLWNYSILFQFYDGQGSSYDPDAPPLLDSTGNLYGTALGGGGGCGAVWRLTTGTGAWGEIGYQASHNPPGLCRPNGTPIFGKFGGLYSASMAGGPKNNHCLGGCGTVFAIYP